MLTAAGHVTDRLEPSDDELLEPELRVFFRDVWPKMSEDERQLVKDTATMIAERAGKRSGIHPGQGPYSVGAGLGAN